MHGTEAHINFDAPAVLRKWPSLQNQRRIDGSSPYLLLESTRQGIPRSADSECLDLSLSGVIAPRRGLVRQLHNSVISN
jgi:hypothetical protein